MVRGSRDRRPGNRARAPAISAALAHLDEFDRKWIMAVNLSPSTMVTTHFQDLIRDIDLHRLAFEVTEHQPIIDYQTLCAATTELRGEARSSPSTTPAPATRTSVTSSSSTPM